MTIFLIAPPINLDPAECSALLPSVMVYAASPLEDTARPLSGEAKIGGNHWSKGSQIEVDPIRTLERILYIRLLGKSELPDMKSQVC